MQLFLFRSTVPLTINRLSHLFSKIFNGHSEFRGRNEERNNVICRDTFDIFRTRGHLNPHDAFIRSLVYRSRTIAYTHFSSYAIAESEHSLAPRSGVGRYFRDEVTQGPSDISPAPRWMVYASQGRVNLGGEKAQVYVGSRDTPYTRESIRKWAYTDTRVHTRARKFLRAYLCHEYSRASHIGFSIFDVSPSRSPSSDRMSRSTRGVIILSRLAGRARFAFRSYLRITRRNTCRRTSVRDRRGWGRRGVTTIWIRDIWTKHGGDRLNRFAFIRQAAKWLTFAT